jgi:hypothetical protein
MLNRGARPRKVPLAGRPIRVIGVGVATTSEFIAMATRPAASKKAPGSPNSPQAAKSKPIAPAPKPKAAATPVVTLKAVFKQLGRRWRR